MTGWLAVLPPGLEDGGALGAALGAAGFTVHVTSPVEGEGVVVAAQPRVEVVLNAAALGAAPAPDEVEALLALMLGAQGAIRRLPGGGRIINLVGGAARGPARAGALALGCALREELRERGIGVTTITLGPGARPAEIAGLAALAAGHPGPGGLEEASLSA